MKYSNIMIIFGICLTFSIYFIHSIHLQYNMLQLYYSISIVKILFKVVIKTNDNILFVNSILGIHNFEFLIRGLKHSRSQ